LVERVEFRPDPIGADKPTTDTVTPPVTPPTAPADPNRPAWLPENFKSPEDFAKSYAESQATLTRTQQELAALKKGETTPPPEDKAVDKAVDQLAQQGVDVKAMSQRFWEAGKLSDADHSTISDVLVKGGIPKGEVDGIINSYVEAQVAREAASTADLLNSVGGEAQFKVMTEWANANYPKDLKDAYTAAFQSGNHGQLKLALAAVKSAYDQAMGKDPSVRVGGGGAGQSGGGYRSTAEMVKDMNDPRYKNDPAFRADVDTKLARTTAF
jgi:hypothetical protein